MKLNMWKGLMDKYREFLPVTSKTPNITLFEGNTPLFESKYISKLVNAKVYFKLEFLNPTGSFKDRGMFLAVSKAYESGARAVICASTGNTSASASAYAAAAGMKSYVLIPNGKIAEGKLAQALMYGAEIIAIDGNFDQALEFVREIANDKRFALVNSVNPYRIEGQKTGAFEICDALGEAPDFLFLPVGNAGNITAYWKGFREYQEMGKSLKLPKMMGYEAEGSAAIALNKIIKNPETIATAIRIGNPASWQNAVDAKTESSGDISYVTDNEIIEAYKLLASKEGIFIEPASAAGVAGLIKNHTKLNLNATDKIVCILTGSGLKDPDNAINNSKEIKRHSVAADIDEIREILL